MPEYALWTLIVSLITLSFALSLKVASLSHSLKLMDKEINSFIEQIRMLNKKHDKEISTLSKFNDASMNKIIGEHNKELEILFAKISELQKPEGFLTQLMRMQDTNT
jgi:hypothetical protein